MVDIVDRLRLLEEQFVQHDVPPGMIDTVEDARAEIERLRRGGCARDQTTTQFCAVAHGLAIENERLRAALLEIAAPKKYVQSDGYPSRSAASIAREALGDE